MYTKHKVIAGSIFQIFLIFCSVVGSGPKQVQISQVLPSRQNAIPYNGKFNTLSIWVDQFKSLLKNRQGAKAALHSGFVQCGNKDAQWLEFKGVFDQWLIMQSLGPLSIDKNWSVANTGKVKPEADFFDITQSCKFAAFAQKIIALSNCHFYLHGDLHGDVFSLLEELKDLKLKGILDDNFRIIPDHVWLVFLGDYVDRGQYGCEVIYTMMRLALANPDRVIAIRGNHEEVGLNSKNGFKKEIEGKFDDFGGGKHLYINRMNDFLPAVLYLGCEDPSSKIINYIQCCHGGIEEEYKPQIFLDNEVTIYQLLGFLSGAHNPDGPGSGMRPGGISLGFAWNDFDVLDSILQRNPEDREYYPGRGYIYGKQRTQNVLDNVQSSAKSKIRGIMRAHQHGFNLADPMMKGIVESKGVYKLWKPYEKIDLRKLDDGLVWTFNVGADSEYGKKCGFDFDTYAKITTQNKYQDWTMEVFNTKVL